MASSTSTYATSVIGGRGLDCNCHEVLGGEANDAGVDTNSHVDANSRRCWAFQRAVECVVDNVATIIAAFAVVVGVKVGLLAKVAAGVNSQTTRCHQGPVISEHGGPTVKVGDLDDDFSPVPDVADHVGVWCSSLEDEVNAVDLKCLSISNVNVGAKVDSCKRWAGRGRSNSLG
jgi:hypothetical protein